jgi:sulfur-oxidizing protein SoxY
VADFRLTPRLARAEVQTRIRLAEAQRIIVLARTSDGQVRRAVAEIRVTTGGCLS